MTHGDQTGVAVTLQEGSERRTVLNVSHPSDIFWYAA